jgi:hypothetical protein
MTAFNRNLTTEQFLRFCDEQRAFSTFEERKIHELRSNNEKLFFAFNEVQPLNTYLSGLQTSQIVQYSSENPTPVVMSAERLLNAPGFIPRLVREGPDYFFAHFANCCGVDDIVKKLRQATQSLFLTLVLDYKTLDGIVNKLFVRGKSLKDAVRSTVLISMSNYRETITQLFQAMHPYKITIDSPPPSQNWRITNLYFWDESRSVAGMHMPVEVQIMTPSIYLLLKNSSMHHIYERMREGCHHYATHADRVLTELLTALGSRLGKVLVPSDPQKYAGSFRFGPHDRLDGIISAGGRVKCNDLILRLPNEGEAGGHSYGKIFPFIVDGSLVTGDNLCLWSDPVDLKGKTVKFTFSSFNGDPIHVALGSEIAYHGKERGESVTLMYGNGLAWVRKQVFSQEIGHYRFPKAPMKRLAVSFRVALDGTAIVVKTPVKDFTVPMKSATLLRISVMSWSGYPESMVHTITIE